MRARAAAPWLLLAGLGCGGPTPPAVDDADGDGVRAGLDCDDSDAAVGGPTLVHLDQDGDGFGHPGVEQRLCLPALGWVDNALDCDDADASVSPTATERCTGRDDDCDGLVDEADADLDLGQALSYWPDADEDGWGDATADATPACGPSPGLAERAGDCDDTQAAISPEANERCGDGLDNDCDGQMGECLIPVDGSLDQAAVRWLSPGAPPRALAVVDLDGDGLPELLLGLPTDSTSAFEAGALVAVSGEGPPGTRDLPAAEVQGAEPFLWMGAGLASSGDLTGDGADDLLVASAEGQGAWLVSGDADGRPAVFSHITGDSGLGRAVATPGDLDGSGIDDLLVGDDDGVAWLFLGRAWASEIRQRDARASFSSDQPTSGLLAGPRRASAGDLDGDGLVDLVLGAPEHSGAGRTWVLLGDSGPWTGPQLLDDADLWVDGAAEGAHLGAALAVLPDWDGDGTADLAVGAPGADHGQGVVLLWSGLPLGPADVQLRGSDAGDLMGAEVVALGDLDGDGRQDLAVGAPGHPGAGAGTPAAGAVLVKLAEDGLPAAILQIQDAEHIIVGSQPFSRLGLAGSVASGDLDGDGHLDLILAAPGEAAVGIFRNGGL